MPYICTLQFCEVEKAELRKEIERLQAENEHLRFDRTTAAEKDRSKTLDLNSLRAERDALRAALQSIANNTCCGQCQEAALVAKAALDAAREE